MVTQLVRHMEAVAEERAERRASEEKYALETNRIFIYDLVYNMRQRIKRHNIRLKRAEFAEVLHKMLFDETYFDVNDGEDKKEKVRVFFEPLIGCFLGDRRATLFELKKMLDIYFPIPDHLNMEWNPVWKTVPYKPRKKRDERTKRLTVQFNWSRKV